MNWRWKGDRVQKKLQHDFFRGGGGGIDNIRLFSFLMFELDFAMACINP
jgi:hypothetical protein